MISTKNKMLQVPINKELLKVFEAICLKEDVKKSKVIEKLICNFCEDVIQYKLGKNKEEN